MFLLCLFLAYVVVRLYEDTTATVRGHEPPRHEFRKKKLAARAAGGGTPAKSSLGRYATGLFDDAWDSAHHRRGLMAEHRKQARERRAAAKIERKRAKWHREDEAKTGGGTEPAATDPAGFDAKAPEAADLSGSASGGATPASAAPASTPVPTTTPAPTPGSASVPAPTPVPPVAARGGAGFGATAPTAADLSGVPPREVLHGGATQPVGEATRSLAAGLTARAAEYAAGTDLAAKASEALYPLTAAQQGTVDAVRGAVRTGALTQIPGSEWMALPLAARADLLDALRTTPGVRATVVPGCEDVEALALLNQRHGGSIDPADIYCAPPDASPAVQEVVAADLRRIAEAEAEAAAKADPADKTDGASPEPVVEDATSTKEDSAEDNAAALPDNVIPFKQRNHTTTTRMEFPVTSTEITGLESAISYAGQLAAYCTHTTDQISAMVPTGDEAAASCEQAQADLSTGGVTGQALTDVASVQEQMTGAIRDLHAALTQLEACGAAASSLEAELESHRGVQEAYNATPDAGSKEFVTAD
ncbi:hypothetical protein [Solihabitans fulvus]|uniref:hypothetical protein n=1 Tax=Solihabitans fulvus TaxID=1892852 RepID=UPI0023E8432F|nr:hypothetical protein [Solihabitans fulvus]